MRIGIISRPYIYIPISIGLLLLVVSRIPLDQLDNLLAGSRPELFVVAVVLNAAVVALWAVRSWILLAYLGHRLAFLDIVFLTLFANTVNNITPASSGEVARAVLLERRYGVPMGSAMAVILLERVFALYLMLVTVVTAWLLLLAPAAPVGIAFIVVGTLVLTAAPTLLYRLGLRPMAAIGRLVGRSGQGRIRSSLAHLLVDIDERISVIVTAPRPMLWFTTATIAIFAVYAIQFALVAAALGQNVNVVVAWAVQGTALVSGILSAIPFGLGPAEGAITILLPVAGVSMAVAGLIAIGFRMVSSVPITAFGAVSFLLLARDRRERATSTDDAQDEHR